MDLGLHSKAVVVTGGSKGIGYAAAEAFLKEGAKVAICARHLDELKEAADKLSAIGEVYYEAIDVSRAEDTYTFAKNVHDRFGSLDVWVNNVGTTGFKKGEEYDDEEIDLMTGVCFKSVVFGCQAAFRYMKDQGHGAIVNISSLAARCPSAGRSTLYGPLKSAVNNLTNTFAGEYCAHNVRVVCLMPGFTETPLMKANVSQAELDYTKSVTLLNRMAQPEEIAKPIVFLASDAASYMTATAVEVSGGRAMTLNPAYARAKLEQ